MLSLSNKAHQVLKKYSKALSLKFLSKRVSSFFSFGIRGGMALEGCLVLPLFLFFMGTLLYGLEIIRFQSDTWEELQKTGNQMCFEAYEEFYGKKVKDSKTLDEAGNVELSVTYQLKPFIGWLPIGNFSITDKFFGHGWIGYVGGGSNDQEKESEIYVYITRTGTKYHYSEDCTYLKVQIQAVRREETDTLRNDSGEKYKPCELCSNEKKKLVYFTQWGNRYHSASDCSSLKRTVWMVPLSLTGSKTPCSKCG